MFYLSSLVPATPPTTLRDGTQGKAITTDRRINSVAKKKTEIILSLKSNFFLNFFFLIFLYSFCCCYFCIFCILEKINLTNEIIM